jgi:two-component system phosphate regulon sensor histidine kinase PhoR
MKDEVIGEVFDGAPRAAGGIAAILIDAAGIVQAWSGAATHLFGYGEADAIGHELAELIVPEPLRDRHRAGVRRAATDGHSEHVGMAATMPAADASGARFPVEVTLLPVAHPSGAWTLGVIRAIDDTPADAEVPPDGLLTTIFERAPEAITLLDREGRQVTVNAAGAQLAGYGPSGRHPRDGRVLIHADDLDPTAAHFADLVAGRLDWTTPIRYRALGGDGRWIWLETLFADLNDVPSVRGYVAFSRDVTADEERRAELVEARLAAEATGERLRRLASARLAFTASVSHELRTPLTSISSAAETLLADGRPDEEQLTQYLQLIERNSRRLAQLVEDLLTYSRLEAGLLRLYTEPVDVAGLVRDVADELGEQGHQRSIAVVAAGETSVWTEADPDRLRQVLENVVGNAVKFAEPGTTVTVTAKTHETTCSVAIENEGVRIDAEEVERIFEPFFRSRAIDRTTTGTGLGLPLSRLIVERHGGTLVCDPEVERGARFVITLPLDPAATVHRTPAPTT